MISANPSLPDLMHIYICVCVCVCHSLFISLCVCVFVCVCMCLFVYVFHAQTPYITPMSGESSAAPGAVRIQAFEHLIQAIQFGGVQLTGGTEIDGLGEGALLTEANE